MLIFLYTVNLRDTYTLRKDLVTVMKRFFEFIINKYNLAAFLKIECAILVAPCIMFVIIYNNHEFAKAHMSQLIILSFILICAMIAALLLYLAVFIFRDTLKSRRDCIIHKEWDERLKNLYSISDQRYGYNLKSGLFSILIFALILLAEVLLYSSFVVHRNIIFSEKTVDKLIYIPIIYFAFVIFKFISSLIAIHRRYKVTSYEETKKEK